MRKVHAQGAVLDLRNWGFVPFQSDPKSMPRGMRAQNNFVQVRVAFYVAYCWREGIFLSSNLAREVLIYIFNGVCIMRQSARGPKRSTIIFEVGMVLKRGVSVF
jgi:hypothetical protein